MKVQLSKYDIIGLIKSVSLEYRRYAPELEKAGEWNYNMDGPTTFTWYTRYLLTFSEEKLYEFYLKLKNGELYLPDLPKKGAPYEAAKIPLLRRVFPTLKGRRRKHEA